MNGFQDLPYPAEDTAGPLFLAGEPPGGGKKSKNCLHFSGIIVIVNDKRNLTLTGIIIIQYQIERYPHAGPGPDLLQGLT